MQTIASSQSSVIQTQDSMDHTVGVPDAPIVDRFAYRVLKRTLDIVVAGLGLLVLSPLFLLVGLLVKLTSPGPVLYPWDVIGHGGRPLRGYKFRTMIVGSPVSGDFPLPRGALSRACLRLRLVLQCLCLG